VLVRYPTDAPPCRASVLSVRQGRGGVGLGNELEELIFTNTGTRPCLLRGYPAIEGRIGGSSPVALHPMRNGTYFGELVPANVPPHGHVLLDFATSHGCDNGARRATVYRNLIFTLPGGGRVSGGRAALSVTCGLSMTTFGLRPRYRNTPAAPGSVGTLQATIRLPRSVRAGSVLDYTVTLANPTEKTVTFPASCPGYTQGLYTSGAQLHRSYRLDCAPARGLAPHARATFAMELPVPESTSDSAAKIGWNLDTPNGPFAGGTIRVER